MKIEECSKAVAEAVKLCKPKVIAAYPITPQTHIVERLADFVSNKELKCEYVNVESEHSAMSACVGAQATGARTFTATCSQGLALMHEILFIASGLRLPIVMANVNRALSAPISIWNDHSDSIAARDSGWIQLYVESSQEAFDTIIQAYKIAEKSSLPVMVNLDGYILSHVYEPISTLTQQQVNKFLPDYKPKFKLDPNNPLTIGSIADPNYYMEFKKEQHEAMLDSIKIIKQTNNEFKKQFKRSYGDGLIETYNINAKKLFVAMGSVCGTIKELIDKNKQYGLIKVKCFRPFPKEELKKIIKNKELIVIDKNISFGNEGALAIEIKTISNNVKSVIAGLGGRDITIEGLLKITKKGGWLQ